MVFLSLELVKGPLTLIAFHSLCALKLIFDLCMYSGDVCFCEIELYLFLVCSILSVFIKDIERFLADGYFQVIPVIIPHEVGKSVVLEDVGELAQQHLQNDVTAASSEQLGDIVDDEMFVYEKRSDGRPFYESLLQAFVDGYDIVEQMLVGGDLIAELDSLKNTFISKNAIL